MYEQIKTRIHQDPKAREFAINHPTGVYECMWDLDYQTDCLHMIVRAYSGNRHDFYEMIISRQDVEDMGIGRPTSVAAMIGQTLHDMSGDFEKHRTYNAIEEMQN